MYTHIFIINLRWSIFYFMAIKKPQKPAAFQVNTFAYNPSYGATKNVYFKPTQTLCVRVFAHTRNKIAQRI